MAVLQTLRTKAAGLLIGLLGLALLAFILSDLFSSGNAFYAKFKDKAFSVDGEVVPTQKYADRIEEWEAFQKIVSGQSSLDERTQAQIKENVFQQMVKEIMLDDQAEKLGLGVSSEEMDDMAFGNDISPILYSTGFFTNPETGQFDRTALTQFLTQIKQDISTLEPQMQAQVLELRHVWAFIENMMRYQRLEEKYTTLLARSVLVNDNEIKQSYADSKDIADFAYVVEKYNTIPDSVVQVSDKELNELYNLRKNNFRLNNELRRISYFVREVVPSAEDFDAIEQEMNRAKERLSSTDNPALVVSEFTSDPFVDAFIAEANLPYEAKEFVRTASINDIYGPVRNEQSFVMYKLLDRTVAPDSVKLQFLPLPQSFDAAITSQIADSLLKVIKGGKDFAAVAQERMPDSNAGEGIWVNEFMLSSAGINKEIFAAAKGDILKLVVNGTTNLIRIEDKTKPVPKVKLVVIQMQVPVSDKTQNAIDNELNQFLSENNTLEKFENGARDRGYNLISNAMLYPTEPMLQQISGSRQVIHWAFNEKVGSIQKFDLTDNRIIASVNKIIPEGYMPLSEVSAELKAELIRNRKAEKIINDLKAQNLTSLEAYAQNAGTRIDSVQFVTFATNNISGIGFEPIFNVFAKQGQVDKLEGPMQGENGVYVLAVTNKTEDPKEFDPEEIRTRLAQSTNYLMRQSVAVLSDKMNVRDNRVRFW